MQANELDLKARYRVRDWPGIAVYVAAYERRWEPQTSLIIDDDGNEIEYDDGDGEWINDEYSDRVYVIMIGDDKQHLVECNDLIPLDELDYCAECGQIGCGHDGRDRSENE